LEDHLRTALDLVLVRALALGDGVLDVGLKEDGVGEGRQNLDKSMPDNIFSKVSTLVYIYIIKSLYREDF
jgi:hypothetical protein